MISVCLACYNGEKYLRQQIDSILTQLSSQDELLISDDGSSDATVEILQSYTDGRIKIFYNLFGNHIRNFEFLLSKASGDYIFLSDQDDVWQPDKVKTCLSYLQNYDLVLSDCVLIDGEGKVIKDSLFDNEIPAAGFVRTFYKNIYTGCCMAFSTKIKQYSLPFPKKINSHDMWIGMVAELHGKVKVVGEKLILFRRHGENFSSSVVQDTFLHRKSPYTVPQILGHRLYMLINLLKTFFHTDRGGMELSDLHKNHNGHSESEH